MLRLPMTPVVLLAFLVFTPTQGQDTPACVLAPNGKMLCCAANDAQCVAKVQKAHSTAKVSAPLAVESHKPHLVEPSHTFANATVWDRKVLFDVAVIGVPFGLEAGYEASIGDGTVSLAAVLGAKGPGLQLLRQEASQMLPYSRAFGASLADLLLVDGQDLIVGGSTRVSELELATLPFFRTGRPVVALGSDQSMTVPLLRAARTAQGEFALVHIDKDLATGDGAREQELSADTALFWAAAEGLVDTRHSLHVGVRGNLPSQQVELLDQELGYSSLTAEDVASTGIAGTLAKIRERLLRRDGTYMPAYISLDLDVLEGVVPGAEVGGLAVSQLRAVLAGLQPFCRVVAAEVRGVAALADPASVRVAAAVAHDLVLLAGRPVGTAVQSPPIKEQEL